MTSILFVDDEPMILKAFQAVMRKHRQRWEMEFVVGGKLALEALARSTFDIVITDLRMPGVDGIEVLRHVREHHPGTVRIVLSGEAEQRSAVAILSLAHQSLTKPCTPRSLESVIERAVSLRVLVGDPKLQRAVGRVRELPPLPKTHQRLTSVLANERSSVNDIADVIVADIAVSASVLKLANSGFFGAGRAVGSVGQAVVLLGIESIKSVVLASAIFDKSTLPVRSREFAAQLHEHSLLVAALASQSVDVGARADAFAAGILHDVGRMILEVEDPSPTGAEDPDHAKIGAYLLALWGLPPTIIDAVALHDAPNVEPSGIAGAIFAAEQIVHTVAGDRRATPPELEEMHRLARERSSAAQRAMS